MEVKGEVLAAPQAQEISTNQLLLLLDEMAQLHPACRLYKDAATLIRQQQETNALLVAFCNGQAKVITKYQQKEGTKHAK